jgi:hypothetical protein
MTRDTGQSESHLVASAFRLRAKRYGGGLVFTERFMSPDRPHQPMDWPV